MQILNRLTACAVFFALCTVVMPRVALAEEALPDKWDKPENVIITDKSNAKLIKNIIIAVFVLAVLGGGYYFALKWEPQSDEANEDLPTADTEIKYVVSESVEDVEKIQIKNVQAEYDIIRTEKNYTIPVIGSMAVNKTRVASAFAGLAKAAAVGEITDDVSKISDYGLDKEENFYTINKNDGTKITVLMGDEVPTGGEFYCMVKGGDKIYTVSSYIMNYIENTPDDYRVSAVTNIEDAAAVQSFAVYNKSVPVIKIRSTTEEEYSAGIMAGVWTMEYPWTEMADTEKLTELFETFTAVEAIGFAENASGITFDYRVEFSVTDKEYKFSIGNAAADNGVYLRNDETSEIYIVDSALRDAVAELNPNDYITKFICIANITEISDLTVKLVDKEYVMQPGDEEGKAYKINGEEVSKEYFKDKYQSVLNLVFRERDDLMFSGEPYAAITYHYNDGRAVTTRFYEYDERNFVAVRNDGSTVKLSGNEISKIEKLFVE